MIKLVVFDIDGVLTDGRVTVDEQGKEWKTFNLKDIDAVAELKRRGFLIGAVTGEDSAIVAYFRKKLPWDYFLQGRKDKGAALAQMERQAGVDRSRICYVGDGIYDVEALAYAALGVCPKDAISAVKRVSDLILQRDAGQGGLWELLDFLSSDGRSDEQNRTDSGETDAETFSEASGISGD